MRFLYVSSSRSKISSISSLVIHNVWPIELGLMSKNAKKSSFSATLWHGISPLIILLNIVGIYLVISKTSKLMIPLGTFIWAISPTDFPSNPLPIGELTDILPFDRSASPSATIV